jgi:hypothetical protein
MKKRVVIITESQLDRVTKRVISEQSFVEGLTDTVTVKGSFTGKNGDELHAFQSTGGRVIGNMNKIVNSKLMDLYEQGWNPKIDDVRVVINPKKKTTEWLVTIKNNIGGDAFIGITSVGSCCNDSYYTRAVEQVGKMLTWNAKPEDHELIVDMETTFGGESKGNITIEDGKYKLRQIFYQYKKPNQYPPH